MQSQRQPVRLLNKFVKLPSVLEAASWKQSLRVYGLLQPLTLQRKYWTFCRKLSKVKIRVLDQPSLSVGPRFCPPRDGSPFSPLLHPLIIVTVTC